MIEEGSGSKSTVEEIRERFDADVERFSNLETGQSATVDAPLAMSLIAEDCGRHNPARRPAFLTWAAERATTRSNYWSGCRT